MIDHDVRATFFVTHESPALQRLKDRPDLFELGIHPNFLPGSTHGHEHWRCTRALHGVGPFGDQHEDALPASIDTDLSESDHRTPPSILKYRCSCQGFDPIMPFEHRYGDGSLLRIPYGWEDTFSMESRRHGPRPRSIRHLPACRFWRFIRSTSTSTLPRWMTTARLKARVSNLAKANMSPKSTK